MQHISARQLLAATSCLLLLFLSSVAASKKQRRLTTQERKVIDYLLSDWNEEYSVTSVDIAMDAVKVPQSDETRFRIGSYIKAHPELHEVIRRWGWVTLVLTPDEKLTARTLINAQRDQKPAPSVAEIAGLVGKSESQVSRSLRMLARYQIIKSDSAIAGASYSVAPHYIKWEPRLDFLFHRVTLERGKQFNTN